MQNMKSYFKLIAIAVTIFAASIEASAQFGVNISYMNSNGRPVQWSGAKNKTNGFTVGIDNELKLIGNFLSIQPGLYYQHLLASEDIVDFGSQLNAKNTYSDYFLAIPLHVKLGFNILPKRMLRVYVFAGPTFEIGLKSADKLSIEGIGEVSYNYYTGKFSSSSDEITAIVASSDVFPDQKVYGRFDVMVGGGVGIQVIRFLDIKVGYDYGLVNRYRKEVSDLGPVNRGQFYVGVGVRI